MNTTVIDRKTYLDISKKLLKGGVMGFQEADLVLKGEPLTEDLLKYLTDYEKKRYMEIINNFPESTNRYSRVEKIVRMIQFLDERIHWFDIYMSNSDAPEQFSDILIDVKGMLQEEIEYTQNGEWDLQQRDSKKLDFLSSKSQQEIAVMAHLMKSVRMIGGANKYIAGRFSDMTGYSSSTFTNQLSANAIREMLQTNPKLLNDVENTLNDLKFKLKQLGK